MYTLIIFGTLSLIQFLYVWIKSSQIREFVEIYGHIENSTNLHTHKTYSRIVVVSGYLWKNFKKVLIIPIVLILIANFVVSLILGGIVSLIF